MKIRELSLGEQQANLNVKTDIGSFSDFSFCAKSEMEKKKITSARPI